MIRNPRFLSACHLVVAVFFFAFVFPVPLRAFGKNKVIAKDFRWRVVSTAHFDIHHTPEAAPLLPRAAHYLEKAYASVTRALDIEIRERTPFFLHVDHNTFEQNNVADVGEGTGGVTEAFKNRFVVFNNGTEFWLEQVITHEFVHVAEFEVLYGGFWKSARLLKSPLYPLWLMEGLAEYGTGELDRVTEDMYLRDAATSGRLFSLGELHGFNHLKPHQITQGYKQGGAALRFLAQEYGEDKVARLLKMLRERFEVTSAVSDLTGQDFGSFDRRYREYLTDFYAAQARDREEPEAYGRRLTRPDALPLFNTHPVFSPDGRHLAYLTDRRGFPEVMLYDRAKGTHRGLAGRQWKALENIHADGRALSFSPDGRWLAFAGEKVQRDYLYLFDVKRNRLRRIRTPFEQIRSPVFHPAAPRLCVVGMRNGLNDLYEITPRGKLVRRLTDTLNDENDPAYSPDGRALVFSRERVAAAPEGDVPERDLTAMDLATLSTASLTDLRGDETAPAFTPDGRSLIFTADGGGTADLHRLDLADGRVARLTRVKGGNFYPAVSPADGRLAFSSFRGGSQHVYEAEPSLWQAPASTASASFPVQPSARSWASLVRGPAAPAGSSPPPVNPDGPPAEGRSAAQAWDTGLFTGEGRPYRFRASTDLFFPLFFYSSTDGLFLAAFWQASEYLGNHQLQTAVQYSSGNDFLDYQAQYTYKRFRPQFFLGAGGQNFFRDFAKTELRRESEQTAGASYPLDRFHRLEGVAGSIYREDRFDEDPRRNHEERENLWALSFVRDTTTGRYLSVTAGTRFRATHQVSRRVFGGDRDYKSQIFEFHHFAPTGRESALAFRGMAGASAGDSPQLFRLGGVDRIRGYARNADANKAARFAMGNLEWRVPLMYLNARTGFMFPDFALKAVYGTLFTDAGYDWSRSRDLNHLEATRVRHSVGAGLRFPVFIIQTFFVTASVDVAKRTDAGNWVWYVSLGPEF